MDQITYKKYLDAAILHGISTKNGDHKTANKAYKTLMGVLKNLRAEPDRGAAILLDLLGNSDPFVVCWSATHLLPIQESLAKETLRRLVKNEVNLAAFNAKMVLQEWNAGRLKID